MESHNVSYNDVTCDGTVRYPVVAKGPTDQTLSIVTNAGSGPAAGEARHRRVGPKSDRRASLSQASHVTCWRLYGVRLLTV